MKLFLIDGHALVFKMYYAFLGRPMVNSKGVDTSILFGFTKYLLELIDREKPSHIAVSFDPPGGTFRNKIYPEYKANRSETPQLVIDALEPLTAIVKSLGMPVLMMPGFEADDVIGSAAKRFAREGFEVYMVSPDKDYGQLVEDHILQYRPAKGGGDAEIYGPAQICEKHGIDNPLQVIDVLTLCGDSADNVPGVQGVGPVGAGKLIRKYGSVGNIYDHLDELSEKQRAMFEAAKDHIDLSHELVTIKTDIDVPVSAEDMTLKTVFGADAASIFDFYEMRSLKRRLNVDPSFAGYSGGEAARVLSGAANKSATPDAALRAVADTDATVAARVQPASETQNPAEPTAQVTIAPALCPAAQIEALAREAGACALCSASPENAAASGNATLHPGGKPILVAVKNNYAKGPAEDFRSILEDRQIAKRGCDIKSLGINLEGGLEDIALMHYLINPEHSHSLESLSEQFLGLSLEPQAESQVVTLDLFGGEDESSAQNEDSGPLRVCAIWVIAEALGKELPAGSPVRKLYDDIEEPLIGVLSRMESVGVKVDVGRLKSFADSLRARMLASEARVRELAGEPELNVSSPKQIGEVIFERLKLVPNAKKPVKGNWSTDEETLLEIQHPIVDAILEYRGARKLLNTYIEPFPGFISPVDGRVHTTFNQALTSTGRLSSSSPNLQNIPVRTDEGREIRRAFTAPDGWVIMSADYSQIELRLMAHFCGDANMIQAFRDGADVHSAMAAKIFHKPLEEVSKDDRRIAKTANFGIMYGISAFGLAQRLRIGRKEAAGIIDDYFAQFPSIKSFIDYTLEFARGNGYVETIFGRRRFVPDVNSHNGNLRSVAERNAVNAPIQGSAADIIKLAMIGVDRALREQGLRARMVLQIHDELVLEVPEEEIEAVKALLVDCMENVVSLSVPLTAECNYGKDWLEAH
ncbi:MAG: DNA polymerase I [Bacteroidales bacterium]|nr:DNA polymerase I [Candidatus Cryptobacteroides aphodequi]